MVYTELEGRIIKVDRGNVTIQVHREEKGKPQTYEVTLPCAENFVIDRAVGCVGSKVKVAVSDGRIREIK